MDEPAVVLLFFLFPAGMLVALLVLHVRGTPLRWRLRHRYRCWTPAEPEATKDALHSALKSGDLKGTIEGHLWTEARSSRSVESGDLKGTIEGHTFTLHHPTRGRNSWRPVLSGKLRGAGGGTLIEVDASVHGFVKLFTAIHAPFFLGFAWFLGVAAFSHALVGARRALRLAVGGTDYELDEHIPLSLADPHEIGAETGAPGSFRAQVSEQSARFELFGEDGVTVLEVDVHGLAVGTERLSWDELKAVEVVRGTELHLAFIGSTRFSVAAGDHPDEDLEWLCDYLLAVDDRHGA